jgi:hypothetical protein
MTNICTYSQVQSRRRYFQWRVLVNAAFKVKIPFPVTFLLLLCYHLRLVLFTNYNFILHATVRTSFRQPDCKRVLFCKISGSHGGEYEV